MPNRTTAKQQNEEVDGTRWFAVSLQPGSNRDPWFLVQADDRTAAVKAAIVQALEDEDVINAVAPKAGGSSYLQVTKVVEFPLDGGREVNPTRDQNRY